MTDEEVYKITVLAQVNQATRLLEAWVTLESNTKKPAAGGAPGPLTGPVQPNPVDPNAAAAPPPAPAGLRITFMRES